jgi:cell division protein FtsL
MGKPKGRKANKKPKNRWRLVFASAGIIVIFAVLLLRVWFSSKAVALAYEIDNLAREKKVLEEENIKLYMEIARLSSPERISEIAVKEIKMIRASDAEVVKLGD